MTRARILVWIVIMACLAACKPPEERAADFLANAQKLYDQGDYVQAGVEARNAVQITPKNAAAHYLLALLAEEREKPGEMVSHLQVAVSEDPGLVAARVKLGMMYFFGQAHELAAEQADAALKLAPDDPGVRTLQAGVLLRRGETEQALAAVDQALAADPAYVPAVSFKASVLAQTEPDQALAVLDDGIGRLPPAETPPLRRMKLVILQQLERTPDMERELLAMTKDVPEEQAYAVDLARLYASQGRVDDAEKVMRSMAAAPAGGVTSKVDLVLFLAQMRTPEAAEDALLSFLRAQPDSQPLQLALGELYELNRKTGDAAAAYEKVSAMQPKSEQGLIARNRLALLRLQARDLEGAGKLVEAILADAPDNGQALLTKAALAFNDQRYGDAVAAVRGVLRREPGNEKGLLLLARAHVRMEDYGLAKDAYRRLLESNPDSVDGAVEFVALALRDKSLGEPAEALRRITVRDPANAAVGARFAEVLLLKGDLPAAEAEARRVAATADPQGAGAAELGRVMEARARPDEAVKAYLQALAKNPDNREILDGLTRALYAQDKQTEAVDILRQHAGKNPAAIHARLAVGRVLAERGKDQEALAILEAAIATQPRLPAAYMVLASLHPGDADARVAAYRRGFAAIPGNPEIGLELAAEYQQLGKLDDALRTYEAILAVNPGREVVMNDLAAALLDNRHQDPASLARAVQLADALAATDNPLIKDTVGWAYFRAGQFDRAIPFLEQAAAAAGDIPAVPYHLGMTYAAAGKPKEAREKLETSLALAKADFPGIDEARRTLAGLK